MSQIPIGWWTKRAYNFSSISTTAKRWSIVYQARRYTFQFSGNGWTIPGDTYFDILSILRHFVYTFSPCKFSTYLYGYITDTNQNGYLKWINLANTSTNGLSIFIHFLFRILNQKPTHKWRTTNVRISPFFKSISFINYNGWKFIFNFRTNSSIDFKKSIDP